MVRTTYTGYTAHTGEGPDRKPQPHRYAQVLPLPPSTPEARSALRESLLKGKQEYEAGLPKSNLSTTMEFIKGTAKKREK